MTRSARPRSSSRRSTSSTASSPAARSTSSPSRAATSSTATPSSNIRATACAATRSTARDVAPIEPDKRWGVALGGPIIRDRLFFFGAYENQKGGFSQDDRSGRRAAIPTTSPAFRSRRSTRSPTSSATLYGIDSGGLVTSRPYTNDRYFARLDWHITDDHRLEATYQRLEEATVQSDDNATSTFPQNAVGLNTFYNSGTKSDYYSGRLYSQLDRPPVDRAALLAFRRSATRRTRSAAARRSRTTRSRASSSASTTRPASTAPSSSAPASRARPTTCRPRSTSIARSPITMPATTASSSASSSTMRTSSTCSSRTRPAR